MSEPCDPRLRAAIETILIGSPLATTLGIALGDAARDRVVLLLPFRPANVTVGTVVHGGTIASLIDTAGAAAALSGADPDTLKGGATATLTVSYLNPADAVDLTATARVLQRGRSQVVSEVDVTDPAGRAIAKGIVTSRLF